MATVVMENVQEEDLVIQKKPARMPKKRPLEKDLQSVYLRHLEAIDIEQLKRPWMASKSFVLLDTEEKLKTWVDSVLADPSRWHKPYENSEPMPVVAVDTETIGLDTRILVRYEERPHVTGNHALIPIYEVKAEIAGVCLSIDGITGYYIPINHQVGDNVSRVAANFHLQRLFDVSHLLFYNAKFDREVMRLTLAINFRDYPFYEDIQILNYINDPKADLGDDTFLNDGSGLKGITKKYLGIEMIELASLTKVTALKPGQDPEAKKKATSRQHVPFTWVPTNIAVWYAAADGICTWLLWDKLRHEAQSRKLPHYIDGTLIDTLTWIERQRGLIDVEPVARISKWHLRTMEERKEKLRLIAIEDGWEEQTDDDDNVIEDTVFDVSKPKKLAKLLYEIKGLKVVKRTLKGGAPSTDADALIDLRKMYPNDKFLKALEEYKEYVALHPENLAFDPHDNTVRIYLKQATVAGGRLAASGGNFERDGGLGLNPQAIKSVGGNWWVHGNVLEPDHIEPADVLPYTKADLHPSCVKDVEEDVIVGWKETILVEAEDSVNGEHVLEERSKIYPDQYPPDKDELDDDDPALYRVAVTERRKVHKVAPGIINNHIGNYLGYAICLVPGCTSCKKNFGILIENTKLDCNQIVNFRQFFVAPKGWTYFTSDYSGIEMRVAANVSLEPSYIKEFLEGTGDFHTLTASIVFPEFNDPNTSKARKKELRSLAKIINFALQYGGTEFTIYSNLKKDLPNITWEEAKNLVRRYWAGVPVYKAFYDEKQRIAREEMICTTVFGRVVKFASQMAGLKIHEPTKEEMENYWTFIRLRKQFKLAEQDNDIELMQRSQAHMDRLIKDPETGVRNSQDYNKFLSKIQRVAANIPSQGAAGDIMRIALNYIRSWACKKDPAVQSVLRIHSSVHDEIDYSVKNEYVPFIVPRITRHMRLRKLHANMKWPVGIECDTEYGRSWDVSHHTTGDSEHSPDAWTKIPGLENYIPEDFHPDTFMSLLEALTSEKEKANQKALDWLKENVHPRAFEVFAPVDTLKDGTKKRKGLKEMTQHLTAILQLHEYWTIDQVPYTDDASMETLEQYEERRGLTPADRGFMPEMGYLGAVPLDKVIRPDIPILNLHPEPSQRQKDWDYYWGVVAPAEAAEKERIKQEKEAARAAKRFEKLTKAAEKLAKKQGITLEEAMAQLNTSEEATQLPTPEEVLGYEDPQPSLFTESTAFTEREQVNTTMPVFIPEEVPKPPVLPTETVLTEDDLFAPEPKKKVKPVQPVMTYTAPQFDNPYDLPVVRPLTGEEFSELRRLLGVGPNSISFMYEGKELEIRDCLVTEIPADYLIAK